VPDSLVVGKNAGNFAESAFFCDNPSRKQLQIQQFADEFPTRASREFFCQLREFDSREQGIRRKPTHSRAARILLCQRAALPRIIINQLYINVLGD
jgi:hypothetical protein